MSKSALERMYSERRGDLIRYCEALLLHSPRLRAQAEEIVQEAFLTAWSQWDELKEHPNLIGWMMTTCRNKCQSMSRKERNRQRITGVQVEYDDDAELGRQQDAILRWLEAAEAREKLDNLKAQLSPLEGRVYEAYFVRNGSLKETAERVGAKVDAVNDAVRRIRRKALRMDWLLLLLPAVGTICRCFLEGRMPG